MRTYVTLAATLFILGCVGGCGDDDGSTNDNQTDAAVDSGPDAATGDTAVLMIVEWSSVDGTLIPVEGAIVAADPPGGDRMEVITGADGLATFENVDISAGLEALSIYKPGYILHSVLNMSEQDYEDGLVNGSVAIEVGQLDPPSPNVDMATVSGDATGLVSSMNRLFVFPHRAEGTNYSGPSSVPYSFDVEQDADFTIVAIEGDDGALPSNRGYFVDVDKAMVADHVAINGPTADYDLDFEMWEVTPQTADASIMLPTRADSPLRDGWPNVWVMSTQSTLWSMTGWAESVDISADGNHFDLSYIWVEPALLEGAYTYHIVQHPTSGEYSFSIRRGYPQAGAIDPPLLDTPRWTTPADPMVPHAITEPLVWEWFDDVEVSSLAVLRGDTIVWYVVAGENATTATLPAPPNNIAASQIIGSAPQAFVYGGYLDDDGWVQFARSLAVRLAP